MSQGHRIDDLRAPRYSDKQKEALAFGRQVKLELSTEAVLSAARKNAQLSDFGKEDFIERLAVQIQSIEEDPHMSPLGRLGVFNDWVLYAENRLRITQLWKDHPEIEREEITQPIIIAGLPRSGTTHLVNLLAADQRFRSLPLWEARRPVAKERPDPKRQQTPEQIKADPRYRLCEQEWDSMRTTMPLLEIMHPMNPDHIHEEIELQCIDFSSYILEWIAYVPRWRDYYLAHDQSPHYDYMKKALATLQWYRAGERWVLKSPQHLEQLPILHRSFPDAIIVVTHRDPVSVISSAATMSAYGARMRCTRVDTEAIGAYWVDRIERLLRACVRERKKIPDKQSVDVLFHEFMADNDAILDDIYRKAGLERSRTSRAQHAQYIKEFARGKHGSIIYNLKEDFGIDPNAVRERFEFYYREFDIRQEM